MRIYSIKELEPIISEIQENLGRTGRVDYTEYYRGQSQNSYKLENGIGRLKYRKCVIKRRERKLFNKYISNVGAKKIDFIQDPYNSDQYKYSKEWFYLYQAQHIGIKTRLLDWTMRWDIALLFAVNEVIHFGKDGQFWVFICPRKYIINASNLGTIYNTHPLKIAESYMINSPFYQDTEGKDNIAERRRARQQGRFFIQSFEKAIIPLEEQPELQPFLTKYIIDGSSKARIIEELGNITEEWANYRHDDNISTEVYKLNNILSKNCLF